MDGVWMENKIIKFKVNYQHLERLDKKTIVNKLRNILIAEIDFEDGWDDLNVFAIFKNECESYSVPVEINNDVGECVVPNEVLDGRWFKITLFGGDLITTNELTIYLVESGYTTDISPISESTPDSFVYFANEIDSIHEELNSKTIDLQSIHDELNQEIEDLHNIHDELNEKTEDLQSIHDELNEEIEDLHNIHDELNEKTENLQSLHDELENHTHTTEDITDFEISVGTDIKRAMNNLVVSIRTYGE